VDDGGFTIRAAAPGDLMALARIYRTAIGHLGPHAYTPQQVCAWAAFADDRDAFRAWLDGAETAVAVDAQGWPLGFAGLEAPARIASLFVAPGAMRRGIGSALLAQHLAALAARGVREVTADASEFSLTVFRRFGFRVLAIERCTLRGVDFSRYAMRLDIDRSASS